MKKYKQLKEKKITFDMRQWAEVELHKERAVQACGAKNLTAKNKDPKECLCKHFLGLHLIFISNAAGTKVRLFFFSSFSAVSAADISAISA